MNWLTLCNGCRRGVFSEYDKLYSSSGPAADDDTASFSVVGVSSKTCDIPSERSAFCRPRLLNNYVSSHRHTPLGGATFSSNGASPVEAQWYGVSTQPPILNGTLRKWVVACGLRGEGLVSLLLIGAVVYLTMGCTAGSIVCWRGDGWPHSALRYG